MDVGVGRNAHRRMGQGGGMRCPAGGVPAEMRRVAGEEGGQSLSMQTGLWAALGYDPST